MSREGKRSQREHCVLGACDIEAFSRDGYVILRGLLSEAELGSIEETFDRFIRGEVRGMGRDLCDMSGSYGRAFADYSLVNAVLPRVYEPALAGNIFEQRASSVARQLIGEDATLDYDQFLAKRPRCPDAVFAWHQDLGYWPSQTPDTRTTTCSLALDDATRANGCLEVVAGSHRESQLRPHRSVRRGDEGMRDQSHVLAIDLTPADAPLPLEVRRGDVTVHNERIVHGSGGNSSGGWRRTYVVAHRSRATVAFERSLGFTHSHNDQIDWPTHLEALKT